MFKILSIDGGGIRGLIPALLLEALESRTGKPAARMFDLVCGTSAGGIIACGLARPAAQGGPVPASDLVSLFAERGQEIFKRSLWRGIFSVGGNLDEQYPHAPLEAILLGILKDARLSAAAPELLVTSYDIENRVPYFFKSTYAKAGKPGRDHLLRDIARATSAAPTYFEPALVLSLDTAPERRALIDGGVFANNPAICAYAEARALGRQRDDILMVSLGTGYATRAIPYEEAKDWGNLGWLKPVLAIMFDGSSSAVDYQLKELLPEQADGPRYYRFDTYLDKALDDLDAAAESNIADLRLEAQDILREQADEFAQLCERLENGI
jgi:hypothetical protein